MGAGLGSIPGGGAEILVDRVRRKISPGKATASEWLSVMRCAHEMGLKTTATMMFGHVETVEERILHLLAIRDLQAETAGFTAFIPWPYQPGKTPFPAGLWGGPPTCACWPCPERSRADSRSHPWFWGWGSFSGPRDSTFATHARTFPLTAKWAFIPPSRDWELKKPSKPLH